jgi:hypothetical protein
MAYPALQISVSELNSALLKEVSISLIVWTPIRQRALSLHLPPRRDLRTTYHSSAALVASTPDLLNVKSIMHTTGRSVDQHQTTKRQQKPNDCNLSIKPIEYRERRMMVDADAQHAAHSFSQCVVLLNKKRLRSTTSADRIDRSLGHDGRNLLVN